MLSYYLGSDGTRLISFHWWTELRGNHNVSTKSTPCYCYMWAHRVSKSDWMRRSVSRYTCKWAVATGGGTLGSKGIRANGARAGGVGPLITGNGGVAGVLSNGCLRGNAPATGGTAAGNRGAECCAILLLHTEKIHSFNTSILQPHPTHVSCCVAVVYKINHKRRKIMTSWLQLDTWVI